MSVQTIRPTSLFSVENAICEKTDGSKNSENWPSPTSRELVLPDGIKPYYDHAGIVIYHGDCRDILPTLPKCDLLLTDPPYGVTQNAWD